MANLWDLLPASPWSAQPSLLGAEQQPRLPALHEVAPQYSSDKIAARGGAQDAGLLRTTLAPPIAGTQPGGILGALYGLNASDVNPTPAPSGQPGNGSGILGRLVPPPLPPPTLPPLTGAGAATAEAAQLPAWTRGVLLPLSATGALAAAIMLGSTTRTARKEDDEFHPQYVVRGGLAEPKNLQGNVSELIPEGHPGLYGISTGMDPNSRLDPGQIAIGADIRNRQLSYTIAPELEALGYGTIPTPILPKQPLHSSTLLRPGETSLSDVEAAKLNALFSQHRMLNPNFKPEPKVPKP